MIDIIATCLAITALLAYFNHRFVKLPTTIGVMVISLGLSLAIVLLDAAGITSSFRQYEDRLVQD